MSAVPHAVSLGPPNATGPPAQGHLQSRATTASSAKNQAAAALTTIIPCTETTMASTTLTLPAEMASPATALSLCSAHDVILALDLGTTTGWALRSIDGSITSGTAEFRLDRWQSGGMRFLRFSGHDVDRSGSRQGDGRGRSSSIRSMPTWLYNDGRIRRGKAPGLSPRDKVSVR